MPTSYTGCKFISNITLALTKGTERVILCVSHKEAIEFKGFHKFGPDNQHWVGIKVML